MDTKIGDTYFVLSSFAGHGVFKQYRVEPEHILSDKCLKVLGFDDRKIRNMLQTGCLEVYNNQKGSILTIESIEQHMRKEEKTKIVENPFDKLRIRVLNDIIYKEHDKATEKICEYIKSNNKIYTIRNDVNTEVWIYQEGIYVPSGKSYIIETCRRLLEEVYKTHFSNRVIAKIEADTYIDAADFFNNNVLDKVCVNNGILDLKTKKLMPFDDDYIFFNKLPVDFDPGATCPKIKQFFETVLKYKEDIPVMQELFGYSLWKEYFIEKSFMLSGNGRNGKGKTISLMKKFIGVSNVANISLKQIELDNFAISELHNKMVNLAGDIDKTSLKETGRFKGLTGRDLLSAPRKFLPCIHFVNYSKMIFCANDLPNVYDTSIGFWERWILIEFPYTFKSKKEIEQCTDAAEKSLMKLRDEDIIEKISTPNEMSGLLNWALIGLDSILKNREFSYSQNTTDVKNKWIRKSDSFKSFCLEFIQPEYNCMISKAELRNVYSKFCFKHKLRIAKDQHVKDCLQELFGVWDDRFRQDGESINYWGGISFVHGGQDGQGFCTHRELFENLPMARKPLSEADKIDKFKQNVNNIALDCTICSNSKSYDYSNRGKPICYNCKGSLEANALNVDIEEETII